MEYNGPNLAQVEESKAMQKWYDWYNSNAPDAIARRKRDADFARQVKEQAVVDAKAKAMFISDYEKENNLDELLSALNKVSAQNLKTALFSYYNSYLDSEYRAFNSKQALRAYLLRT